jgi:hypothetical protein
MDAVASAADELSVLIGILSRCEAGRRDWTEALIHCALTQRNIAGVLRACASERVAEPVARGWRRSFVTRGSVYGELLDDVLGTPDAWRESDRELLGSLVHVRPPQFAVFWLLRGRAAELMLLPVGTIVLTASFGTIGKVPLLEGLFRSTVVVGALIMASFVLYSYGRRTMQGEVGSITLQVNTDKVVPKDDPLSRRSGQPMVHATQHYATPLWRGAVVEEVLGLGRFRFGSSDIPSEHGNHAWTPTRLQRITSGVRRQDISALLAARSLREAKLEGPAKTPSSNGESPTSPV